MKKMLNELVRYGKFAFALAFALCCFSASATAITPAEYFAKKVDFTISGYSGTSTLANFPVLVKLSTASVSGLDYSACGTDGENIRFIDAANNLLPFEIDTWNPSGESFIWVSVPSLSGTSTKITMCYGANGSACPPAGGNVWALANYKSVWHMDIVDGDSNTKVTSDSVASYSASVMNHSTTANAYCGAGTGLIGGGYYCNANNKQYGVHGDSASYAGFAATTANTFTYTAWAKQIGGQKTADTTSYPNIAYDGKYGNCGVIWHTGNSNGGKGTGIEFNLEGENSASQFGMRDSGAADKPSLVDIHDNKWHYAVVRYDGGTRTIWIDGVKLNTKEGASYTNPAGDIFMGARKASGGDTTCIWTGDLDEMRFRDAASSDDWLAAEYANVASTSFLSNDGAKNIGDEPLALGWTAEEMTAGGAGFRTDGTLLYAYSRAGTSVNGIPFTNISFTDLKLTTSAAPNVYISNVTGDKNSYGQEGQTGDFASMLANCWIWPSTQGQPVTITLKGLTASKTYLVQLFAHRNNVDLNKQSDLTFAVGEQVVKIGDKNGDVYLGGSLIGIIQPTASTYDIQVTYAGGLNASLPLNAIQVRELGDTPTPPEPTSYPFYIGDTGYDTWSAAYGALATSGGTITLGQDVMVKLDAYLGGKSFTIDLHGKVLSCDGGYCTAHVTIVDRVGGGSFDTRNSGNFANGHLDLSELNPEQITNKISANNGAGTVVVFPASMTVEQCKNKVSNQTTGTRFVVNGDTYVWDGTAWVLDVLQPATDAAANVSAIQAAIDAAALKSPAGTVVLGEGTFEINAALDLKGGVTLKGQGWDNTIIKQTDAARCVAITNGAKLEGVTLTGGQSSSGAGAGALVTDGTISWCCISNNHTTAGGTSGGGVSFTSGQCTIDHSIIVGNSITGSSWGGGIGGKDSTGTILIDTCLVYGNEDKSGSGGGIGFQKCAAVVTVRNTTVVANKCSNGNGHGLYFNDVSTGGKIVLVNDILTGNGDTECNTFIAKAFFDTAASKNCLISGTQTQLTSDIYKDANVRTLFADQTKVISSAPTFAGTGDYHLATGSAGIAAGATYTGIGEDLDHNAFAATPSMGCYEYDGVAPTTYAVTWSGAANATVSAKVDGAAITSGASVEDGKEVVFTVTPNTNYEFASAPTGWTLTDGVLSCTKTVNGTALAVVIPDATPVPQPTDPAIGSLVITPNGSTAWFSLSGITLGTDSGAVPATSYSVDFAVKNSAGSTIKDGTKLTGQTSSSCSFDVAEIPDGTYTGYVTITTDKGKTATKSAEFTIDTSSEEPTIPVGWTASPMTGSGDIRTDGALLYAYMRGNKSSTTYIINTVPFSGYGNANLSELTSLNFTYAGVSYRDANTSVDTDDPYEQMLGLNWRGNAGNNNLVLKNLVAGNTYLVQIVLKSTDSLGGNLYGMPEDGASTTAPGGVAIAYASGDGWENGGSLIGVFKATGSTESIALSSSVCTVLNAIQVRDVSPVETVTPGTSASDTRNKIQAAIDRAAPTHREVKLSEGTFLIDTQLYVTNGVTLSGQGWKNTIIKQTTSGANSRCVNVSGGAAVEGVTLTGGHVTGNWAGGAGAEVNGGRISWCCVSSNIIDNGNNTHGAGIRIGQDSQGGQIDHTIVIGNTVESVGGADSPPYGGGVSIFRSSGNVLIDTCLIVGNEANYPAGKYARGGGISLESVGAEVVIRNTSIVGNKAINSSDQFQAEGGGLYVTGSATAVKHLRMENCIVADNETKGSDASDVVSTTNDVIDYCIFDKEADKIGEHSAVASSESIFVNAKNGDYHLGDASPAVGFGTTYEGSEGNVDLDGDAFEVPPSIGCYEYKGTGLVPSGDPNQIQAAIDAVAPVHGIVHLGEGLFELDQQLFVTNGVTLAGKGWENTIIKQTSEQRFDARVMSVNGGSTVTGITVTGGKVGNGGDNVGNESKGGGIFVDGDATISWCCVTNNYCERNVGGGIYIAPSASDAYVRIDHTIVVDNDASTTFKIGDCGGGGIGIKGKKGLKVEIDTCLVYGNGTGKSGAYGGGIGMTAGNTDQSSLVVWNTTIADNQSADIGGGVYVGDNVDAAFGNCIFSGNTPGVAATCGDANVAFANNTIASAVAAKSGCCFFGAGSTAETAFGALAKTGDVKFVSGDYRLAADSPAIAAGSTLAGSDVDLDKVAFAATPAMGCYEYASNVAAPKFTPASGTKFDTQLEVRINGQGTVYYTTDGTVPTEGSSTYNSARTISDTTKFMARAYLNGVWSAVASATYVKAAPDAGDYYVSTEGSDFADGLTPETAFRTIERAVEVANDGQKVTILPGTFEIDETIVIDKAITVTGSGWDATTIQPTSGTKIRLVELDNGAKLEGVTLTGGDVRSGACNGAAAWVKNGTISWCCITNNSGNVTGGAPTGSAVTFYKGQGTIDHCIVAKNTGATYCRGAVGADHQTGPVAVDTCLIYGNNCWYCGGVGFSNFADKGVTIQNCTVADNNCSSTSGAGGIFFDNGTGSSAGSCRVTNTIVTGNKINKSTASDLNVSNDSKGAMLVSNCFFGSEPVSGISIVNKKVGEAQFTNAGEGDYHPSAGWEDVIGKGVNYTGIGDTLDGMPFNDPPSIGCYEPSIGFGKVTFAYPAKHEGTATVQLIGLSDGASTARVTFQYGPDKDRLCDPIEVVNGVGINTDIVATMSGLNANCEYAYLFTAVDDKGETTTRSGIFTTYDWDTLQFSTVKANPTSNSADVSVTIMKLGLGATNATVYVQWGTNYNDLCQAIRISTTAQQKQTLTYTIPGLKNDTDYVVRFSGENDIGDTATRDGAFKTLEKEKLALGEPKVSNLGQTTADIAVTVPTLGENAKSATVTLKWWIDGTTDTNSVVMSSAAVRGSSLSQQLTGLTANTLYRYEIVAVNDLPSPETETKSVTGGFTTDDPNIGADDYHDSYPTVDADHVVTYDADSAGNPSTLEPGSPYVVVAKEGYNYECTSGGKKYYFRNEYDYQYNCSARIGDTYYLFLTDAVAAAQANDKIELLRNNYAISGTMQINRKLTIEGNGYAVKVAAPFLDNTGYVNPKCTATPKTVFKIVTGGDVVINDMLVMGGGEQLATGAAGSNSANEPAIVVTDTGILEMDHVTVKRSQGGLWIDQQAKVHLNACNLIRNARFCGGGFYSKGVLVMENSSLSENRSLSSGGGGAAAENQGLLVMNNCVICNNGSTEYGGAINNLNNTSSSGFVYMMNMTMAGNFSSHSSDYGGGIGLHQSSGDLYMLNCILCNNYHYVTTSGSEHIDVSDIRSDSGNNHFLYSVYGVCTGGTKSEFTNCFPVDAANHQDVFKGYSPFARTYEQNKTTVVLIPGPSFDTAPSNDDARYAPLTENGSEADVGNDGVYTYFDASAWRSAAGNRDVSWLKMAYREEDDTTLTALGNCAMADEEDLVTTYYETAFDPTISDRELGVVGASGFGTHKKTYTLYLLENPVNGGVSDNLILTGKSYDQGFEVTVVAMPDAKCTFLGWFDAKEATEPVSTKLAYTFVMDSDKSLLARFSEPSETHRFIRIECEQEAGTHDLFPIEITKDWLKSEFGYEPKTDDEFNAIEAALNEPDPVNGLNHKWMNYVLGLKIGDPDGKIWIRGSQNSDSGKLTFSVQELSETKDCGFIVRYRLPKMNLTKDETSYNREGEYINTKKGTFEDAVSDDLQYRIIDMIFIPTNKNTRTENTLNTSFEYVTTVNTAGVMKVASDKKVEILASPWVGFSPTNNPTIKATDYVKASCLNKDDILYIYDRAHSNYLAWAVQDGQWAQKDTYQIINGVVYRDDDPADIANTNSLPRGMGAWLERSNTKSPIYLYGQVDPSPVTTSLEPGFNLVGNPYPYTYDASQLGAPTGSASDQIVIPTGASPIVSEYRADFNGGEGAWVHQGYTVTTQYVKGVAREVKKACLTTDGLTLPIGHGFWYNNLSDEQIELVWPKNVNVSEIK